MVLSFNRVPYTGQIKKILSFWSYFFEKVMRACAFFFFSIIFYDSHDLKLGEIDLGETDPFNSAHARLHNADNSC